MSAARPWEYSGEVVSICTTVRSATVAARRGVPAQYLVDCDPIGEDDNSSLLGHLDRGSGDATSIRAQRVRPVGRAVPHHQRDPGTGHIERHRLAHQTKPDESDARNRLGRRTTARWQPVGRSHQPRPGKLTGGAHCPGGRAARRHSRCCARCGGHTPRLAPWLRPLLDQPRRTAV